MKAVAITLMMMAASLSASAMGHPHNMFAAHRKAVKSVGQKAEACRNASTLTKRAATATVRAVAPGAVSFGWAILRKKFL